MFADQGWLGICGTGPAGLSEIEVGFLELVDRMGDPRKPYGEVAWLWGIWCGVWENGRPVGICQNVWGDASGVWLYGETAIPYGEAAYVWGGRGIAWGTKVA